MNDVLRLEGLVRTFKGEGGDLRILRGADFAISPGEIVALVAPSGSGKSTLLHLAGLLERPDGGAIRIGGVDAAKLPDSERTRMRRDEIGFVYQAHHLLAEFTALENVALPQMIAGRARRTAEARAMKLLDAFGLAPRAHHSPGKLSGGERQRVAIARAMANAPKLLLADEPTGNLDDDQAERLMHLIRSLNRLGTTVVVATHNLGLIARHPAPVLELYEGRMVAHG